MDRKFVGTIIDSSYFIPYEKNGNTYKMCEMCDKPRVLMIKGVLARGKQHDCDVPRLIGLKWEWGQFAFIKPKD